MTTGTLDVRLAGSPRAAHLQGRDGAARIVPAKCAVRRVSFKGPDDFFDESVVQRARLDWQEGLRRMVADPPELDACLRDLRPPVSALVKRALSPAG